MQIIKNEDKNETVCKKFDIKWFSALAAEYIKPDELLDQGNFYIKAGLIVDYAVI
ncbi:hypothetical protein QN395_08240 [Undibacterium sp. RTI2.2]|uniref:hypothetical protein n=1 Tax=unclassified Undibacterium TaxID=2630295 RepID=UPI002AB3DF18|nr:MULTISPECIES: hypothetical protein [unclassified Undibacterium]MDY7539963.1 hypothetical protein [Undibacterium sp. 5I1]MEB0116474.1 hypothetical protein [Undibacterium sp. RTI2.2]MEB0232719.1 hypothetical protein [Undibacterium sp. 10I3]MEB0257268.1 hypothetical protein [Undibacterium sp. 5I1]